MRSIVFALTLITLFSACGGGGGGSSASQSLSSSGGSGSTSGGSTTTSGGSTTTSNTPSYSYTKIANMGVGSEIDLVSRVLLYRETDDNRISWIARGLDPDEASLSVVQNSFGETGNRFTVDAIFLDSNGERYDPNFEIDWTIEEFDQPYNIGNALDEFLYWWSQDGTFNDTTTITQTDYTALGFGYWTDESLLAGYLETEYVVPLLLSVDYGDNCFLGSCDSDYNEDLIASVAGDFTANGDMPDSGVAYMDGKGIALFHSKGAGFTDGRINHYLAAESDGDITIDHDTNFIGGYLTFDAVFSKRTPGLDWPRKEGWSAGSVTLDGEIYGNVAMGTVAWDGGEYGSGHFIGAFFGPEGKEFGGVITANDDLEDEFSQLIVSFVLESR